MTQLSTPTIGQERGFAGQLADAQNPKDVLTSLAVAAAVVIGNLVVTDAPNGDDAARLPASALDITNLVKGIALHAHSQENTIAASPSWPINAAFPTLTNGRVYVAVEDAVDAGQPVFARFQGGNEGGFRSDVDGANAVQVPKAVFRSTTTGAGIAVVELNLP